MPVAEAYGRALRVAGSHIAAGVGVDTPGPFRRTFAAAGCVRRKALKMTRPLVTPLLVAAFLLALGAAAACDNGDDGDGEDGTTPAAVVTPDLDALRAEAEALCPAEFVVVCIERYISFATGSLEGALCITPNGKWFMETPQGAIGDACSDPEGVIVAIVGGE